MDRWSAAALARWRPAGGVLRALLPEDQAASARDAVLLAPLPEAALEPLFTGPERIFHLRTDAARALWNRTGGLPARIAEEVAAWVRAGLTRWDGDSLAVDWGALERLQLPGRTYVVRPLSARPLPQRLRELLVSIDLAVGFASPRLLAAVFDSPVWRMEADLDELVRRKALQRLPDGTFEPLVLVDHAEQDVPEERRREVHRKIAELLPRGTEGRLFHIVAGEVASMGPEVAAEAIAVARRRAIAGHLGQAVAVLGEGLLLLRKQTGSMMHEEVQLLLQWLEIALEQWTTPALDRVLYEIVRSTTSAPELAWMESLARAALAVLGADGERALAILDAAPPRGGAPLERWWHGVRVWASRRGPIPCEQAIVAEAAAWVETSSDPRAAASLAGWRGWLRYREGRFDDAAALHAESASRETWAMARIAAELNCASALMEAFRLDDAGVRAVAAQHLAAACRQPYYEARAEWLGRSIAYRRGQATAVDGELVDLVAGSGCPISRRSSASPRERSPFAPAISTAPPSSPIARSGSSGAWASAPAP